MLRSQPVNGCENDLSRAAGGISSDIRGPGSRYNPPALPGSPPCPAASFFDLNGIPPNGLGRVVGPSCPFCSSKVPTEPLDCSERTVRFSCLACGHRFALPIEGGPYELRVQTDGTRLMVRKREW